MPTAREFARFVKLPSGGTWYSHSVGGQYHAVQLDVRAANAETMKTLKRFQQLGTFIRVAVGEVEPEFGAYMRYSPILEKRKPHIARAIEQNGEYIRVELQRRLGRLIYKYSQLGVNATNAKKDVEAAWEDVLNRKPRWWAIKRAQVEFGFHRYTIRGYGKPRAEADVLQQQEQLHAERDMMRRRARTGEGPARAAVRSKLRRYRAYSGGTHGIGGG